jgi:hypothetical protein
MPLVAACSWLSSRGWKAAAEPDVADRAATWTFSGSAEGLRRSVERAYGVSSIVQDGVLWFGGDRRLQRYSFGLGGGDPERVELAVRKILANKGHVVRVGGRLVVLATPVMIEAIRQVEWFAGTDYQVKLSVFEIVKTSEVGVSAQAGVSLRDTTGLDWRYSLDAEYGRTRARLVRSWRVSVIPGEPSELDVSEERIVTRYTVDEDTKLQSGTESHKAGLQMVLTIGELSDGVVSLGYQVEASAFMGAEGLDRRVSSMRGGLRCALGGDYLVGEYEGDIARRWLGLSGVGKAEDLRRVLIRVRIVGGERLEAPAAAPLPADLRSKSPEGGAVPAPSDDDDIESWPDIDCAYPAIDEPIY